MISNFHILPSVLLMDTAIHIDQCLFFGRKIETVSKRENLVAVRELQRDQIHVDQNAKRRGLVVLIWTHHKGYGCAGGEVAIDGDVRIDDVIVVDSNTAIGEKI
jgi:hypothetical protein